MKKRWISVLCVAAMLVTVFTGCGTKQSKDETQKQDDGIRAYVGGTIFESSLDPVKGAMSYGYPFVNEALLQVNSNSEYVGDLATDWSVSEDALTYTFHLKENVKFSDGSDFTADDVVFTYETVKQNQANNENVDLTRLDTVTAVDDHTVEFQLSEAYSPFLDTTAMLQIVPSDSYDSKLFDTQPIGTGAYKVVQYDANQQIILEANDQYYGDAPEVKKVTLVSMEPEAAFSAAKSGDLDIVMVGANYSKEKVEGMTAINFETMDVRNISLPVNPESTAKDAQGNEVVVGNNVTSDKVVREALSIGIDRQEIIDNAFNGVGKPAVNFTDNLVWASTENYEDGRVDEAISLLEADGWKDSDQDGIREKGNQKCTFDVYAPGGDEDRYNLAVALSENAKNLGIDIQVKTATWDEVVTLQNTSGIVWGWGQYSPTVLYSLYYSKLYLTGGYDNVVGYKNDTVDQKIDEALAANNQEDAIAAWKEVQEIADADYPELYLVNIEHCYFISDRLDVSVDTQIPHPHGHGSPIVCNMKDWKFK